MTIWWPHFRPIAWSDGTVRRIAQAADDVHRIPDGKFDTGRTYTAFGALQITHR